MAKSYMILKIDFKISHKILVDDLSASSFQDLTKKRGCCSPFRWFSTLPSVSNKVDCASRVLYGGSISPCSRSLYRPMMETEAIG